MKKSLPFRLYAGLFVAVILVLLVAAFTIISIQNQEESAGWVNHSVKVVEDTRDIRYTISQMRSSRRTYWITGEDHYLDSYFSGLAIVPNKLQELKKLITDNPTQVINLNRLDSSLSNLFVFWNNRGKES